MEVNIRRTICLPSDFPKIITLCGSTRFMHAYTKAQRELTLLGYVVISVGLFGHQEGMVMNGPVKAMLDALHLRKILLSDAIYVVNPYVFACSGCGAFHGTGEKGQVYLVRCEPCGATYRVFATPYVGSSTKKEIEFARERRKEILSLNPLQE